MPISGEYADDTAMRRRRPGLCIAAGFLLLLLVLGIFAAGPAWNRLSARSGCNPLQMIGIPIRAFASPQEAETCLAAMREWREAEREGRAGLPPS